MKRACIWLTLLLMALLLSGCGAGNLQTPPIQWQDQVHGAMADPMQKNWTYRLTTEPVTQEYHYAENQRLMVSGSYTLPRMTVYHENGTPYDEKTEAMSPAVRVAQKFNAYFDAWLAAQKVNFNEIAAAAITDYHRDSASWQQQPEYYYTDAVEATFWRNDHIACVTLWSSSFTGGAHQISNRTCVTFDMRTGEEVSINHMVEDYAGLRDAVALDILSQIQNGKWVKYYDGAALFDDYEETIPEWMTRSIFFGDGKMTVVFSVYDIAPYAAGEQAFEVSYELIEPYLNDYGREVLEIT